MNFKFKRFYPVTRELCSEVTDDGKCSETGNPLIVIKGCPMVKYSASGGASE